MPEYNSVEHDFHETPNIDPNLDSTLLSDQKHFRLNKINDIEVYFVAQIKERELMSKRLSIYMAILTILTSH